MNSSWFRLSFIINIEQIEPNLNGVFANKYDKIRCWPRNFENFQEFWNSSISLLRIFIYNRSVHFGIWFRLLRKSSKLPSIFLGFQSIRSVNQIQKTNGKKALFAITYCDLIVLTIADFRLSFKTRLSVSSSSTPSRWWTACMLKPGRPTAPHSAKAAWLAWWAPATQYFFKIYAS